MTFQLFAQIYVGCAMFAFVALILDAISAPQSARDGISGSWAIWVARTFAVGAVALALAAVWPIVLVRLVWTAIFPPKPLPEIPLEFKRQPGARR